MDETPLDRAALQVAAEGSDAAWRLLLSRVSATDLFLLLEAEAEGDQVRPVVTDPGSGPVALAFDREARLAEMAGGAPYAAVPGGDLAALLAAQSVGLCLNLGTPGEIVVSADQLGWIVGAIGEGPSDAPDPVALEAPFAADADLLEAIGQAVAPFGTAAGQVYLASLRRSDGTAGYVLASVGAEDEARPVLAGAFETAVRLAGVADADIAFAEAGSALAERLARVGVRFDAEEKAASKGPGLDPERPPILR